MGRSRVYSEFRKFTKAKRDKALRAVKEMRERREATSKGLTELVGRARAVGASWGEIAEALGCSRAWAQRQYRAVDHFPSQEVSEAPRGSQKEGVGRD